MGSDGLHSLRCVQKSQVYSQRSTSCFPLLAIFPCNLYARIFLPLVVIVVCHEGHLAPDPLVFQGVLETSPDGLEAGDQLAVCRCVHEDPCLQDDMDRWDRRCGHPDSLSVGRSY